MTEREHLTRRMLQALDAYWLHCDGLPRGRYPRGRYDVEDWWTRFEKYRKRLEALPSRPYWDRYRRLCEEAGRWPQTA